MQRREATSEGIPHSSVLLIKTAGRDSLLCHYDNTSTLECDLYSMHNTIIKC